MAPRERRRLDSWKEIAAYFDRDVSTVMRWEKRSGMPVHRVPGAKRGRSVFAYVAELDAWLADTPPDEAALAGDSSAHAPSGAPPPDRRRGRISATTGMIAAATLTLGIAVIATLAATGLIGAGGAARGAVGGPEAASLSLIEPSNDAIVARDLDAGVAWVHRHPDGYSYENIKHTELFDLEGDGRTEVLVAANVNDPARPAFLQGELYGFSSSGDRLWRVVLDDAYHFGESRYSSPWVSGGAGVLRVNGSVRIAWIVHHYTWWPAMLVLLDGDGVVAGKFVSSGWIATSNVLPRPGGDLLLVGGTSNSRGGAMLAVLDAADITASSPEEPGSAFRCLDCPGREPSRYLVFPPSEVNQALGLPYNVLTRLEVTDAGINVVVREGPVDTDIQWVYELTADFELVRATPGDTYWPRHRLLHLDGKIDHSEEECPERLSRTIRSWTPESGWQEVVVRR